MILHVVISGERTGGFVQTRKNLQHVQHVQQPLQRKGLKRSRFFLTRNKPATKYGVDTIYSGFCKYKPLLIFKQFLSNATTLTNTELNKFTTNIGVNS